MHTKNNPNRRFVRLVRFAFFALLAFSFVTPAPVQGQAGSMSDLIAAVNAYRASINLAPYDIDGGLMSGDFNYLPPSDAGTDPNQQDPTQPVIGSVVVSTPNSDGSIVHIIKYGETLVDIAEAYGISLNELISLNKLDPKKPVYYANQPLIIRLAFTTTPYMTTTFTPRPPTRTPLATRTPRPTRTATPFHSPIPTRTNTVEPPINLPTLSELGPVRPIMAYAFIGISVVGLLVLFFTAFGHDKKG